MSQELTLFAFGGITEHQTAALQRVPNISKSGLRSETVKLQKKSELAKIIGTKDKDAVADFELEVRDALLRLIRAEIGGLDASKWAAVSRRIAQKKDGSQRMTIVLDSVVRSIITAEKISKAWGITMEEAEELIKKHCKIASPVVDIQSSMVPPVALPERTLDQVLEARDKRTEPQTEEEIMAALKAEEEAARLAAVKEQKQLAVA